MLSSLRYIKTFVFDMDGVLTNGSLLIDANGNWLRRMNTRDGYALQLAIKTGYKVVVISGSESAPIAQRLHRLGIEDVFMKVIDKRKFMEEYISKNNCETSEVLAMGDDIPDYSFMEMAGFACCPADAAFEIKKISSYISPLKGGEGCVRDVIEKVLKLNNHWPPDTSVAST